MTATMTVENDTRGWIMTIVSGIACVLGASIICVDYLVRLFPGKKRFRIENSNTFLSASLSLSAGVMVFSALYSMLPAAKNYLIRDGFAPPAAAWVLIACFLGGATGIQVISRFCHHFIPSHVVDCDHSHGDGDGDKGDEESRPHDHPLSPSLPRGNHAASLPNGRAVSESTPLLFPHDPDAHHARTPRCKSRDGAPTTRAVSSLLPISTTTTASSHSSKPACDFRGPCYGFSDPCAQDCPESSTSSSSAAHHRVITPTVVLSASSPSLNTHHHPALATRPALAQHHTTPSTTPHPLPSHLPPLDEEQPSSSSTPTSSASTSSPSSHPQLPTSTTTTPTPSLTPSFSSPNHPNNHDNETEFDKKNQHHHHLPPPPFLSLSLQTSLAISLHKLPEGFITFATNHANPHLGLAVFIALFIHNITEGFALALPLYLALGSRGRAMAWSSALGGVSQPLGGGVAALWLYFGGGGGGGDGGEEVYGAMFAVTAGIMTCVGLQLFAESLSLGDNRVLCVSSAFVGMAVLGVSFALTAE